MIHDTGLAVATRFATSCVGGISRSSGDECESERKRHRSHHHRPARDDWSEIHRDIFAHGGLLSLFVIVVVVVAARVESPLDAFEFSLQLGDAPG
jgi:hypothetical protein